MLTMSNDYTTLEAIQPYMKNVNCIVIVIDGGEHRQTSSGTIKTFRVADHTGSINVSFVNPDFQENFQPGDILRIRGAQGGVFESRLHLSISGRNSECRKTGDFCMLFKDHPNFSSKPLPENLRDPYQRDQHHRDPIRERKSHHNPPYDQRQPPPRHNSYRKA